MYNTRTTIFLELRKIQFTRIYTIELPNLVRAYYMLLILSCCTDTVIFSLKLSQRKKRMKRWNYRWSEVGVFLKCCIVVAKLYAGGFVEKNYVCLESVNVLLKIKGV